MKLLLLIFIFPCTVFAQSWQQLEDLPAAERDDGVVFTIENIAYFGTGMDAGFQATRDFYAFDPANESWSPIAPLPEGKERQYACAFSHAGKGFVFGGIDAQGNYLNDLWRYSPQSDSWTELFGLPGAGRSGMSCFTLADTMYVVGGKNAAGEVLDEVWAYVISSNGWLPKADLPIEIWRGLGFSYNGKGYVGLGANSSGLIPSVYRYTPATDSWEIISGFNPTLRSYPQVALASNQLYIFAGQDDNGYLTSFERVDLSTWNVLSLNDFPAAARRGGASFAFGSDFYTVAGVSAAGRQKETWVARGSLGLPDPTQSAIGTVSIIQDHLVVDAENWTALSLFNALGQKVGESTGEAIPMRLKENGIYMYMLQSGGSFQTGKVIWNHSGY